MLTTGRNEMREAHYAALPVGWWVGPGEQRRGVGSRLLRFVEEWVQRERARMLVIETSSQPRYEGTRAFYLRHQYEELARVRDFYFVGDDKVEYGKRFSYGGA